MARVIGAETSLVFRRVMVDENRITQQTVPELDVETRAHVDASCRRNSKCIRGNSSGDSFQNATHWMLFVSQFFGIMPLIGLGVPRKSKRQHLSFSWRGPSTMYTMALLLMSAFETILCIYQIFESGFFFGNIGALTFYLLALISRSFLLTLGIDWPRILSYWRLTEDIFLELPYTSPWAYSKRRISLANRINFTFAFISVFTLGECATVYNSNTEWTMLIHKHDS